MSRARTSAAQFARLLDSLPAPVYAVDDERCIVHVNAACGAWLGVPAEELIGRQVAYHTPGSDSPIDVAAARLCPPPEVFAGSRLSTIVHGNGLAQSTSQRIEFLPILSASGEVLVVLAMGGLPETSDTPPNADATTCSLHEVVREFRTTQAAECRVDRLIGRTPTIVQARQQVRLAVESPVNVLVVGPKGSGKEQIARTIHQRGGKPLGPLIPLDCANLGVELLVSTLESAIEHHPEHGSRPSGLLWLKDLNQLPPEAHSDFARLLVSRGTSLQVIATSVEPLTTLVAREEFPADLACAVATVTIQLPALADRLPDLPLLAQSFLEEANALGSRQLSTFTPEALELLAAHPWSGNLDDLAAAVAEAHQRAAGPLVQPRDLPQRIHLAREASLHPRRSVDTIDLEAFLARVERELIERALAQSKGNKSHAAKLLGMTRPRFYRRLEQLKMG